MAAETTEEFLHYYMAELDYLSREGEAFSRTYPKAARNLGANAEVTADPHVDRMIESFAFLTARLQQELDANWPEVPEALLTLLYPHLVAPIPSMAIAQFTADPNHPRPASGDIVPRGTTLFAAADGVAEEFEALTCRFQTVYPVTIWPLAVETAVLEDPLIHGFAPDECESVLRLKIVCTGAAGFAEFGARPESLRFHLHADDRRLLTGRRVVLELHDLIFNHARRVLVRSEGEAGFAPLPVRIREVGFGPYEAALPHPPEAHQGYRLLQEYFVFPDKFLFFDVMGLPPLTRGRSFELFFLLDRRESMPLRPELFQLGCTPIVNLFQRTTEPIRLEPTQYEYRLVPDSRWERATEIHTVLSVAATAAGGAEQGVIAPFFSFTHAAAAQGERARWLVRRRRASRADLSGTEIMLSFHDKDEFANVLPQTQVLFAQTLCTNRGVAGQIDASTRLEVELDVPVLPDGIRCLTRPTPQLEPPLRGETLWRLVSHLSLNHRSLAEGSSGIDALHEILRLYGHPENPATDDQINALKSVSTARVVGHIGTDAWRGFCRGTEIALDVDEDALRTAGGSLFLFGQVLSHFFALYATINSFTRLVLRPSRHGGVPVRFAERANDAPLIKFPHRDGEKIAL